MSSTEDGFHVDMVELCTEIMDHGVLPVLVAVGWGGALIAQFSSPVLNLQLVAPTWLCWL